MTNRHLWQLILLVGVGLSLQWGAVHAASIERLLMPGPLSEAHAQFEDECGRCHDPLGERSQVELCTTCHESIGEDIAQKTGFHGKHPDLADVECQSCHREHKARDAQTLAFDLTTLNHDLTDFALHGAHQALACDACHSQERSFSASPSGCNDCHAQDDPHSGSLGVECGHCHTSETWQKTTFNHADSDFPLLGAHAWLSCSACHADQVFTNTPQQCVGCHKEDDAHNDAFGQDCGSCHVAAAWTNTTFDHGTTGFFLRGAHNKLMCASCHYPTDAPDWSKSLNNATCGSCHAADDPHEGRRGTECGSCHTEDAWQATFDHDVKTGFALVGEHQNLECESCHKQDLTTKIASTCHACHTPEPHEGQLGEQCSDCHNQFSFSQDVKFNHHFSRFPLLGRHLGLTCIDCHAGLRFHDVSSECQSCHEADDPHGGRLGASCGNCHNPVDWRETRFEHGEASGFSLTGMHADLTCASCHQHPMMLRADSEADCGQCHKQDDPHEGNFGSECGACHTTESFAQIKGFGP